MSRPFFAAALTVSLSLGFATSARADVELTIRDGKVSLIASGATLREILAEWERVGQTRIINIDQIAGEPVTLQLDGVPESQALGVLLRSVNGYVAAPRPNPQPDASRFDRIMIMPGTPAPRMVSRAPAPFVPPPAPAAEQTLFQQAPEAPAVETPEAERPVRTVPAPAARGPVFGAFPRPQAEPAPATAAPSAPATTPGGAPGTTTTTTTRPANPATGTPAGVSVPGMLVPSPPAADQQQTPGSR